MSDASGNMSFIVPCLKSSVAFGFFGLGLTRILCQFAMNCKPPLCKGPPLQALASLFHLMLVLSFRKNPMLFVQSKITAPSQSGSQAFSRTIFTFAHLAACKCFKNVVSFGEGQGVEI